MSDSGKNELKKAPANIPETCPQEATTDTSSDTPMLTMRIGNMTFLVGIHFNKDSKETMEDKIHRMIRRDIETGNF